MKAPGGGSLRARDASEPTWLASAGRCTTLVESEAVVCQGSSGPSGAPADLDVADPSHSRSSAAFRDLRVTTEDTSLKLAGAPAARDAVAVRQLQNVWGHNWVGAGCRRRGRNSRRLGNVSPGRARREWAGACGRGARCGCRRTGPGVSRNAAAGHARPRGHRVP